MKKDKVIYLIATTIIALFEGVIPGLDLPNGVGQRRN